MDVGGVTGCWAWASTECWCKIASFPGMADVGLRAPTVCSGLVALVSGGLCGTVVEMLADRVGLLERVGASFVGHAVQAQDNLLAHGLRGACRHAGGVGVVVQGQAGWAGSSGAWFLGSWSSGSAWCVMAVDQALGYGSSGIAELGARAGSVGIADLGGLTGLVAGFDDELHAVLLA